MRINNNRKAPLYNLVHTVLITFFVAGIGFLLFEKFTLKKIGIREYLIIIVPVFFIIVFYIRGRQIFEYNSDGENLFIKNRHILPHLFSPTSDHFPKSNLISYNIVDALIFKRLYLNINEYKKTSMNLKYDISNLTKKELADLKHSLNKIVNTNKRKLDIKSQEVE